MQDLKARQFDCNLTASHLIGIGFNRSGTSSLTDYLRQLGIETVHWRDGSISRAVQDNVTAKKPPLDGLVTWRGFFDLEHYDPSQPLGYFKTYQEYFRQIEQSHPNAYFVFNYRSCHAWIKSLLNHPVSRHQLDGIMDPVALDELFGERQTIATHQYMQKVSHLSIYGLVRALQFEYEHHIAEVADYFHTRHKLVVFDLDEIDTSVTRLKNWLLYAGWSSSEALAGAEFRQVNMGATRRLSYMICCMNRTHHLETTLPQTLQDNQDDSDEVEIVVVHYLYPNCQQQDHAFQQWIYSNFADQLASGYLKYIENRDFTSWMAGRCRHTAFWYTRGQLVYNLDCDNFTGPRGGRQMIDLFDRYGPDNIIFLGFNGVFADGSFGRICLSERNHFLINSYPYDLPTVWSHDDSWVLLKALSTLRLKLLVRNRDNCLIYVRQLFKILGLTSARSVNAIEQMSRHALIEVTTINEHQGISHKRSESFNTIGQFSDEQEREVMHEDLELGAQFIRQHITEGDIDALIGGWQTLAGQGAADVGQKTGTLADPAQSVSLVNPLVQPTYRKIFYQTETYREAMRYQQTVFYCYLSSESRLDWVLNLALSMTANALPLTVVVSSTVFKTNYGNYPAIWFLFDDTESEFRRLLSGQVTVKLSERVVVRDNQLPYVLDRIFNNYPDTDILTDIAGAIEMYKSTATTPRQERRNLVKDTGVTFVDTIDKMVASNDWTIPLIRAEWNVWGDPTEYSKIKIGPLEQARRRGVKREAEGFLEVFRDLGIRFDRHTDQTSSTRRSQATRVFFTYGFFCNNRLIPIDSKSVYLVWQPDQSFDISKFPHERTLVLAHIRKTSYPTFLVGQGINLPALLRAVSGILCNV